MPYDARQIAGWFIERAAREGRRLSLMSLLKLTYIAHGWHLEMRKSPLFKNRVEAWQYGPVVPEVYYDLRPQGIVPKAGSSGFSPQDISPQDADLLEQIYNIYGKMTPFRLSELTHEEGGPWAIAREMRGWYAPIPNDLIQSHYEKKRLQSTRQDA